MDIVYRPKFTRSAKLVRLLTEASSLSSWVERQMVDVSWVPKIQRDALVCLAHYSTKIEGNPLTLPEVEALSRGKDLPIEEKAKQEVLNYFAVLRWIWTQSPEKAIREKDLLRLHGILTRGVLIEDESGAYKVKPNVVYGHGKVIYRPPPPEAVAILTCSLLAWLNSKESHQDHAAIAAAIAHHRLVSIHPFSDGNGRAARSLGSWVLYRRDFDTHHIFALDEFFEHDRDRYYREIQAVRDNDDDLSVWLEYIGEGIVETLRKTQARIQVLRAKNPEAKIILNRRQERILQILSQTPRMGGGELARVLGVTRSHLGKLLKPLLKIGLAGKEGSTKAAVYYLAGIERLY
ncbi:MAG: Fic family protein [Elusimicrobiota bacterium]